MSEIARQFLHGSRTSRENRPGEALRSDLADGAITASPATLTKEALANAKAALDKWSAR
jgi:hypothetical protein